ncbi:MAG TPA: hypothetical protein H9761_16485 [Candidatus Eisenbergiella merdavium]|uniref:Glycosyl hydrolase family 95 catalytic domain-containing protein n=1 Tax=Candidatus Eisenbergiella merdavium TaxID=2838551 RepID=A0A9D2SR77_9FIRM|nr:hypothetical protein [Candidatus Eisenbergiella merdavium]
MKTLNRSELISRADLHYQGTVKRREGGFPLGDGQMGAMLFTSPSALKFALNRCDVFAANSYTNSFNRRHSDYGYGIGFVDIDFVDYGEDVFDEETRQHLSMYRACAKIEGRKVKARAFVEAEKGALCVQVKDERDYKGSVQVKVDMMRPSEYRVMSNLAVSRLTMETREEQPDTVVLRQVFTEREERTGNEHYCTSVLAVWVEGAKVSIRMNNEAGGRVPMEIPNREFTVIGKPQETQMRLCIEPQAKEYTVCMVSEASFSPEEDIVQKVLEKAKAASEDGAERMFIRHQKDWADFWEKSYVQMESQDGIARKLELHYTYFLYLMNSSSRGKYPPNFGGMIFSPCGDYRNWGTMQWWNNLSLYYNAIQASGHFELMEPLFSMYGNMREACVTAARQQFDTEGMHIPEVTWFNGPQVLPEEIADEMKELYLFRKPWEEKSAGFTEFVDRKAPHESRYNYKFYEHWEDGRVVYNERGFGPFGATTYMFGSQAAIAYSFWKQYQYTKDEEFLRDKAYPMIRGVAEFFMNFPLTRKGEDGKYHIYQTCTGEAYFGCTDGMENVAGMRAMVSVLLKAARILGADREQWEKWERFAEEMAPLPTTDMEGDTSMPEEGDPVMWSNGREPILNKDHHAPSLYPCDHFDLSSWATMDTDPRTWQISMDTLKHRIRKSGVVSRYTVSEMSGCARMYAAHGFAEEFKEIANAQLDCVNADKEYCYFNDTGRIPQFENRLTVREGVNCISAQRLGNVAAAVQLALCQSSGGGPAEDAVIKLFAAVPAGWDVSFMLWCQGGFRVEASMKGGRPEKIRILSTAGGTLRLYNPFGNEDFRMTAGAETIYMGNDRIAVVETEPGEELEVKAC